MLALPQYFVNYQNLFIKTLQQETVLAMQLKELLKQVLLLQ